MQPMTYNCLPRMVDVNQELDKLAIHLKNVTLPRDVFHSEKPDDALCCGIDLIFQGLRDTKLKQKSLKILEQSFKASPSETQQRLMQKISERVENEEKFVLLKQILDLLDGPQVIRQSLITGLQKICTLAIETIQKAHPTAGERGNLQGVCKDILDSELFNAIKICVSVFQNYGTGMMNDIFGGASDQTWSTEWVQELIARLLVILRCKTIQKEIIGLAAIVLAHVVNNLPKLDCSLQLASVIIYTTEKNAEITEHHIGPLRIRIESCFAEDFSILGKIMAANGLLSVCNPNILLVDLQTPFKTGSILMEAFTTISEACSESLHAAIKYSSFQVLNSWMECIARITMPVYHEKVENKEPLFQESSQCCSKLLDLIWDNRESMIDGVSKYVHTIFRRLIQLHESENITLGKQLDRSELFEMIAAKLLHDPWYMKGRYSLLCELLPHFDRSKILQLHPSLASEICKCFGTSTLQSIANECYRSVIFNARFVSSSSSDEKLWTLEYWSSVWMNLLLKLLNDENLRAVHNAVLYFIPTTLQHVDGIFERIKDSISKELQVSSNCLEKSPAEIVSIKSRLLFGYCSIFKLARKSGLATLSDIDTDILKESLVHVNDDVRAAAISVLCFNNKTTEPITELEETLLWEFLPVNLNCASSSFRQSFFVSLKAFFARIRDSSIMMLRNYIKESKRVQNHRKEAVQFPERLGASIDLVEKIVSLALRNLFPGACFQRRRSGLQIFYTVVETFSSPSDPVKKGRTVESLKSLTDWVSKNGRWNFITLQNLKTIVSCLEDQHDEIRELAMTITNWFHFETMKIDDIEKEQFCKEMLSQATALMSSPKVKDTESGAILMEFIAKRFTKVDDFSLNEEASSSVPEKIMNKSSHVTITELVMFLVNEMHDDIKKSENDVLHAAVYSPVFGYTLASRRCFFALIQSIRSSKSSSEDTVKSLAVISNKAVQTCILAIKTAMSVFSKKKEGAQGTSPSFADINDGLRRMLLSCESYSELKDSNGYQHCLELLSSFCWLNIKAASLFLGDVGKILSLQSWSSSQKKAVITYDLVNVVGRIFKETLINCRHKGVIESSCTGFQIFCKSLSSENLESLCDWLDETIAACDKNDLSSSITKRSAGLPMFVQSIISSCVSSPMFNLGKYMKWLIKIARRPVPSTGKMETDLPQVQAMNILRGIYRDSSTGTEVLQFAEDGLMLAVEGFSSSSWAIRNAAQILLGALVPRMLGQRVTQADKSYHNSASPDQFFSRYPALEEFFLKYLRLGVDRKNQVKLLPALVPILTLLSKLRPCGNERYSSVFFSLLDNLLSSYVITVRNLAASSLVAFLSLDQIPAFAGQTILKTINTNCSCNYRHGLLLVIKKLLGISDDDPQVLDLVLTKGIWPHLDALLNFNHGKCTEYLSRSTVFEITSIIVSFLSKMSMDVSILLEDKLFKILKQQVQNMSSNDNNDHQEQVGYCLYMKRFAKASIDLVICMQSRTVDQTNEFLETLLSTNQNLLEQELLQEVTCHLENCRFLHDTLKLKICRNLIHRILSQHKENTSLYLNCWCALGIDFQTLGVTEETLSALLQISTQLLSSESSHRKLSASLPFVGTLITPFCETVGPSSSLYEDFTNLLSAWSEKVYTSSAAGEREILRISSLRAVGASVEGILLACTESRNYSSSNKNMEHICTRLILALLLLVQDEDEDIRKETCLVVNKLNPTFYNECQLNSPLQNNLALKAIFVFVSKNLWNNVELIKELFTILAEICNVDDGVEDTENQRSLLLFEQEGSNLFAEELVFASEIINCLKICCSNVTTNAKTLSDDIYNELRLTLNQAARNNVNKLKRLVECADSKPIYICHGGFLGNSKTFVSLYICVVLSGVLHVNQIVAENDREIFVRLLEKLKERHICNETLGIEVDNTLKLMKTEHE